MARALIRMPQLGESVTEGTVEKWLKQVGDLVERDEPLVEIVTDKVNAEIPSPMGGRLVQISITEGTTVMVGAEIAQIDSDGNPETDSVAEVPDRPGYSPAVRHLAEENGIDLGRVTGTGEAGRVTRDDVLAVVKSEESLAGPTEAPDLLVPWSAMRRSIGEHMSRSLAIAPHAWTMQEVDVTELVRHRETHKAQFLEQTQVPLSYLALIVPIICQGLKEFPYLNASWSQEGILLKQQIHLGLAVALEDGLIVPVIKHADERSTVELATTIHDLATRARSGQILPDEVHGGTFTLNNTGATGSVASQPIINQPQAAILTTESIIKRPIAWGEGIAIRHMMNICLAFDHRILDGRMAGMFLNKIKAGLEAWPQGGTYH
ncbi:MAG TPA: dihydrolipoamide acetyltransferase family protein [Candidatus Dormibacteraeota bacterium]|nr:dihydrolipoamide acetyltransferase family protein [Candidatus Dormibacteraeota bacterium]